jgi:hypothetical protein
VHAGLPIQHFRRRGQELDEIYRRWFGEETAKETVHGS